MTEEKHPQSIYINYTYEFLEAQSFQNPLYIVESSFMKSDIVFLSSQQHNDFLERSVIVNKDAYEIKAYTKPFINFINNKEFDALIIIGNDAVLELGKYYIHLSRKLFNSFYEPITHNSPTFVMVSFIDYPFLTPWQPSNYPNIVPDYILAIVERHATIKMSTLLRDTLTAFQQGIDQYMFHMLNENSSRLTLNAIHLMYRHVIAAYKRRTPESIASLQAAIFVINNLFSLKRLGLSHHISKSITHKHSAETPKLSFMLLQQSLKVICMDKQMEEQLSRLAVHLDLDFNNPVINSAAFIESLKMMQGALKLPSTFEEIDIDNETVFNNIDEWSTAAVKAVEALGYNIHLSDSDMRSILLQLM